MSTDLLPLLAEHFPDVARRRGVDYHERGLVEILQLEPGFVEAMVAGTTPYYVAIEWEGSGEEAAFWCECPAFEKYGPCKHLFAVLLQVDGHEAADEAHDPSRRRRESRSRREKRPAKRDKPGDWTRRIAEMRRAAVTPRPSWSGESEPEQEILYDIDVASTFSHGSLVLRAMRRQRRKDGSWGALKELDPRRADTSGDSADARILRRLSGAATPGELFDWRRPGHDSTFVLDRALGTELLPLLAETGRLRWRSATQVGSEVSWDSGDPWLFEAALEEQGDQLVLSGGLVRGDERRTLEEPVVLIGEGFVVLPEVVARFDPRGAMALVVQLRSGGPLRAPTAEREEFEHALAMLPGGVWRCLPWLGDLPPATAIPQLFIEGAYTNKRKGTRLACRVWFDYGSVRVQPDEPLEVVRGEDDRWHRRDLEAERGALDQLWTAGVRPAAARDHWERHGTVTAGRVPALVHELMEGGWLVHADEAVLRKPGGASVSVRSGVDWFELEGGLVFGDELASFPELLAAARTESRTVRLGDGSLGVLPEDWMRGWGLLGLGEESDEHLRFPRQQGWILDALLAERENVTVDADFERYREKLQRFRGVRPGKEPRTFKGVLRDYQREGLGWFRFLRELGLGGCLADDMGLGKTVQILALLEARRGARGKQDRSPSLVVAPRSVTFNWMDEAARFTPNLTVVDYTGPTRRERWEELASADLVVTTYGTLRRDAVELSERTFDYVVLDEAQAIKNASSQTAKAARLLRADNRLALSGTPIENHLGELWSLFEYLNPGMLGRSGPFRELLEVDHPDGDRLARAMRPFFLRRTKDEVLDDLPEKTEQTLLCDLGRTERRRYDELRKHYRAELLGRADQVGWERTKIHVLEALLRLRQCACHPGLLAPERRGDSSAKLEALLPRLEETAEEGHKALVFSQFTKLLGILRERLDRSGIPYEYLDGRTRKRKECVERFQSDPDCPLFLISLKAGGHGLNLTAADNVFLLDPWWNPAVEAQAIDRAHRLGQSLPVFAYRLIARNTVEERVIELQDRKRELAASLFAGKRGALRDMTREDLEALLS